jgi:hypothetical protein
MRFLARIIFLFVLFLLIPQNILANEKFATIVNPIRNRDLWKDQSLKPLDDQYQIINQLQLKSTWLIQDDVLNDSDLITKIKEFNSNQELGLFLEISPQLANKSKVYYPSQTEWYSPKAVFLSAYNPTDRKKLIDQMVLDFKNIFGFIPKSAGAWWIDSWSQNYLAQKYNIYSLMIVADQKTTDNYGVWGQWWGYPYIASLKNILVPGNSKTVVIQWAQRDLEKAYNGFGTLVSNYSLQANDYLSQKLNINYFKSLASQYLSVEPLGQITIGLETGMESVGHEQEYEKQLTWAYKNGITSLTMSQFSDAYKQTFNNQNPTKIVLGNWLLTPQSRSNSFLSEEIIYKPDISFPDKFIADQNSFLSRDLNNLSSRKETFYFPFFLLLIPVLCWLTKSITPVLLTLILYFPIFRSYYSSGWKIFYGPILNNLLLWQVLILSIFTVLITKFNQKYKIHWTSWFSLLTINLIIFTARYSVINGQCFFGFLVDSFKFIGISLGNGFHFLNQDLSSVTASSMLKFDPSWIWQNWWGWLIIYPIIEIGLVFLINKLVPNKIKYILTALSFFFIIYLFNLNPIGVI